MPALEIPNVETEDSSLLSYQLSHLIVFDDKKTLISILTYACCPWQVGSERNASEGDCLGQAGMMRGSGMSYSFLLVMSIFSKTEEPWHFKMQSS